jgi:hypothetical protein
LRLDVVGFEDLGVPLDPATTIALEDLGVADAAGLEDLDVAADVEFEDLGVAPDIEEVLEVGVDGFGLAAIVISDDNVVPDDMLRIFGQDADEVFVFVGPGDEADCLEDDDKEDWAVVCLEGMELVEDEEGSLGTAVVGLVGGITEDPRLWVGERTRRRLVPAGWDGVVALIILLTGKVGGPAPESYVRGIKFPSLFRVSAVFVSPLRTRCSCISCRSCLLPNLILVFATTEALCSISSVMSLFSYNLLEFPGPETFVNRSWACF